MKKLFLSDFDGTLVNKDILDVLCGINGKEEESKRLNEEFIAGKREGLPTLKQRIDFLRGISSKQIKEKLDAENYLVNGAIELFTFLKANDYITVLHSGNILPVLEYYQQLLHIDYIVGNTPRRKDDVIIGIELEDFASRDFKVLGCQKIINELDIDVSNIYAIGDSPADLAVFGLASTRIAINSKGGIEQHAEIVLKNDLKELIPYLQRQ